jgi:DNA-binding LacI/PurR family transcriptional regulator
LATATGVGASTLQKALTWLVAAGLLVRHRQRGTFVAETTKSGGWVAIMTRAMFDPRLSKWDMQAARAIIDTLTDAGVACRFYQNHCPSAGAEADCAEIDVRLTEDIETGRVRGMLVVGAIPPNHPEFRLFLRDRRVPIVEFSYAARQASYTVTFDRAEFVRRAVDLAASRGYRHLAMIENPDSAGDGSDPLAAAFHAQAGLRRIATSPASVLRISDSPGVGKGVEAFRKLWRRPPPHPGGLIVTDDYVMLGVTQAAQALGVVVPDELWLATSANAGGDLDYPLPVTVFPFSADQLVREAWAMLEARINGKSVRHHHVYIAPLPAEERVGYLATVRVAMGAATVAAVR